MGVIDEGVEKVLDRCNLGEVFNLEANASETLEALSGVEASVVGEEG